MNQEEGDFLRVIVPNGPSGWVLKSDLTDLNPGDLTTMAFGASGDACVLPKTLAACISDKPTGCSTPGTSHAVANQLKRTEPPADAAKVGEGSRVKLVAFLSEGRPHPNTGESVNCNLRGQENNDFHISVSAKADDSEFNGIVVELIPQDRPANWTLTNVEALRGKKLLIEGGLFYDNLHVPNRDSSHPLPGQPKRFALWEVHPVASVMVCTKPGNACNPAKPADWTAF